MSRLPGRPNSTVILTDIRFTVIDEADEMVRPDWIDDMRGILGGGMISASLLVAVKTNKS